MPTACRSGVWFPAPGPGEGRTGSAGFEALDGRESRKRITAADSCYIHMQNITGLSR